MRDGRISDRLAEQADQGSQKEEEMKRTFHWRFDLRESWSSGNAIFGGHLARREESNRPLRNRAAYIAGYKEPTGIYLVDGVRDHPREATC